MERVTGLGNRLDGANDRLDGASDRLDGANDRLGQPARWSERPAWATGSMERVTGLGNRLDYICSVLIEDKTSFYSWGLQLLMC